jgi:DNA ligase (NAD+)
VTFFRQDENKKIIDKLRKAGVKLEEESTVTIDSTLAGQEFVLTGRLKNYTRPEAEERIEKLGGKAGSSVTQKTSYLVAGEDPGSKLSKAQSLGIAIISEEEFMRMIGED